MSVLTASFSSRPVWAWRHREYYKKKKKKKGKRKKEKKKKKKKKRKGKKKKKKKGIMQGGKENKIYKIRIGNSNKTEEALGAYLVTSILGLGHPSLKSENRSVRRTEI